jgi:MFS family permease
VSDIPIEHSPAVTARNPRRWLIVTTAGCAMIVLAMIVVALVILDKPHFGSLVGTWFLEIITSGLMVGSVLVLVGAWNLPQRKNWRGRLLLAWGVIALTSPAFGLMFLLPWGVLVLTLPVVISILIGAFREAR